MHVSAHRPAVRGRKPEEGTDALLDVVKLEEAKYASLCVAVINDRSPWMVDDIFDQSMFWAQQKNTLPVHYAAASAASRSAKMLARLRLSAPPVRMETRRTVGEA